MINKIKTFYSTKRIQKVAISVTTVAVVVGATAIALFYRPVTQNADATIALVSKDIKSDTKIIVKANVEIIKDERLMQGMSLTMNKPTSLKLRLETGEYSVRMTSAPIESDGSTYKIPSKIDNIVISNKDVIEAKTVNVEIPLERIDVKDMTKEQLKTTINRINEKAPEENKDLIKALEKQQETAVTDETTAEDAPNTEDTPNAPDTDTSTPDSIPKPDNKPSDGGTSSNHAHNWVANMVTIPEVQPHWIDHITPGYTDTNTFYTWPDGCKIEVGVLIATNEANIAKHDADHGVQKMTPVDEEVKIPEKFYREITSEGVPEHQEQRGYKCSCGATKN